MDSELHRELLGLATEGAGLRVLEAGEARAAIDALRTRYVTDPAATWWWAALRPPSIQLSYGHGDGLELLRQVLPPQGALLLAATDDGPPPWPIVEGSIDALIDVLRELRMFEYWIAPSDFRWVVFDTHDNTLVIVGSLAEGLSR